MTASDDVSTSPGAGRCPECGKTASGNFCNHCGANLGGRFCNQCGAKLPPGSKFCSECGSKADGTVVSGPPAHRDAIAATVGGQNLPWWIAGAAMFGLIFMLGLSMVRPGGPAPPTAGSGGATASGAAGTPPDISNMAPIDAADALFNRVMRAVSASDSAQAQAFMPMAIAAYQRARPLNNDGLFHLSMLNRTAMNLEAALDVALEILESDPNHLLGLAAAAEAALELGLLDEAETYYQRIYDVYDDESQRALEEYDIHGQIVVQLKDDAERFLAGR
jgi:zinc-ribbon domain